MGDSFGERIKEMRKQKGLSREQPALTVGVSANYLGEIERGAKCPSLPVFVKICIVLGALAEYLIRAESRRCDFH